MFVRDVVVDCNQTFFLMINGSLEVCLVFEVFDQIFLILWSKIQTFEMKMEIHTCTVPKKKKKERETS